MNSFSLFLLQADGVKYFQDDDPMAGLKLLILLGGVIVVGLIIGIIRRVLVRSGVSSFDGPRSGGGGGFFAFQRAAYHYRLTGDQTRMLKMVFRNSGASDPQRVLENTTALDRHFKQTYRVLNRNADDPRGQQELARLFSTRIAIESSPFGVSADSIPKITERSAAVLRAGGNSYNVTVLGTNGRRVTISCPVNALGTPMPLAKGLKVALSFFIDATRGIACNAEVLGMIRDAKGTPVLEMTLKGKPETLLKRKSRRRQINILSEIQIVNVTKSRGKNVMTVDPRKFAGDIQDISTGGCSIKSKGAFRPGGRIKISFRIRDSAVAVVGQILRINRGSSINAIIHVKFVKVSLKSLNTINATVFEYNEA